MTADRNADTATLLVPTEHDPPIQVVDAWVGVTLRELTAPERLRAVLVAHEMVAAARARRAAPYVLRLGVVDRHRTLEVAVDEATAEATADAVPDPAGPLLVAALAGRHGVEQRARARTTWAELRFDVGRLRLLPPRQPRPGTDRGRAG